MLVLVVAVVVEVVVAVAEVEVVDVVVIPVLLLVGAVVLRPVVEVESWVKEDSTPESETALGPISCSVSLERSVWSTVCVFTNIIYTTAYINAMDYSSHILCLAALP